MIDPTHQDRNLAPRSVQRRAASPFLRWPGGKRWLVPTLRALLSPADFRLYVEPFLGGGAVYFGLLPARALLGDINSELISTYQAVRDSPDLVIARLKRLAVDRPTYGRVSADKPVDRLGRAERLIYLNRTGFSGIYRVNRQGQYNVPYGGGARTATFLWTTGLLVRSSEALKSARLVAWDFERTMGYASAGSLVYCDPTYTVTVNGDRFRRYHHSAFRWQDQLRLREAAEAARQRGAVVLVSNADVPEVRELYAGELGFAIERSSTVSRLPELRRRTKELLIALAPSGALVRRWRRSVTNVQLLRSS